MTTRPVEIGAFEFVIVAARRAKQLTRGCTPLVVPGIRHIITAQREVADGRVQGTHTKPKPV